MRGLFALLLLSLTGCAFEPTDCGGKFRINDQRFSGEQYNAIVRAGQRWNEWIGREHFVIGSGDAVCTIEFKDLPPEKDASLERPANQNRRIFIDPESPRTEPYQLTLIVMHELGHTAGLDHTDPTKRAIMNPATNADDFNEVDREECKRVGFCKN